MPPKTFGQGRVGPRANPALSSRPYLEPVEEYEEDLQEHPTPNERLTQAIKYLANENIHSSRQFEQRLDLIERFILRRYPAEGLTFSPRLYNRVKAQVDEHKRQIKALERAEPVAVHPGPLGGTSESESSSTEEAEQYRGLARTPETFSERATRSKAAPQAQTMVEPVDKARSLTTRAPSRSTTAQGRRPRPKQRTPGERHEDVGVRTKVWQYGGGDATPNEPEVWHADMPALLPFGETIYMADWESDWIDADLRQNAGGSLAEDTTNKDKGTAKEAAASSSKGKGRADEAPSRRSSKQVEGGLKNVTHVKAPTRESLGPYDSGSRFKLPPPNATFEGLRKSSELFDLGSAIKEFNKDKRERPPKEKYSPRSALPIIEPVSSIQRKGSRGVSLGQASGESASATSHRRSRRVEPPESSRHAPATESVSRPKRKRSRLDPESTHEQRRKKPRNV